MSRFTESHTNRTDTIVVQEEEAGELLSMFVVSEHVQDKFQTQVAEIWLGVYNVEELVRELQNWLQSREANQEPVKSQPVEQPKRGAGKLQP